VAAVVRRLEREIGVELLGSLDTVRDVAAIIRDAATADVAVDHIGGVDQVPVVLQQPHDAV
jgi:hypothetical protein